MNAYKFLVKDIYTNEKREFEYSSPNKDPRLVHKEGLKKIKYDVIIVDGPAQGERKKIMEILDELDTTVPIFIDDMNRKEDRELFGLISGKDRKTFDYDDYGYII